MWKLHNTIEGTGANIVHSHTLTLSAPKELSLCIVEVDGVRGVLLHFENPPVHQMDMEVLEGYDSALRQIEEQKQELSFLIFSFAADAIHAGGDLKETLAHMDRGIGIAHRRALRRLEAALRLYRRVRALARDMRVVSVLAGGDYYGGSAEVALWADFMVGDPRSRICMSEAAIGLIPGWSGVARLITKAGVHNARCLVETARKTNAWELREIGVLNEIAPVPTTLPYPRKDASARAKQAYHEGVLDCLLRCAFRLASSVSADAPSFRERICPSASGAYRRELMSRQELEAEVRRRSDPQTYRAWWGEPLSEAGEKIAKCGKPLAPQSVAALHELFSLYESGNFDEECFAEEEMLIDLVLYRHPLLEEGIRATLGQYVPNFSQRKEEDT